MLSVVHHSLGDPAKVLRIQENGSADEPKGDQVQVRVTYAPIHPGDLLGVTGSPAFGKRPVIGTTGRVPGFEGSGVISAIGPDVDPALGLTLNQRVAFFPANGAWREKVVVSAGSIVPLPDSISDEVGAQLLINMITAGMILRAGHAALPADARENVTVIQTGAGSAVGRLLTTIALENGVMPLRLVRSAAGADHLARTLPGAPVFATDEPEWESALAEEIGGRAIHVALDGVGGPLLGDVAAFLADGTGTIINYGSLGGENTDIRLLPPRSLTLKGVNMGSWSREPEALRRADVERALRLGSEQPDRFEVAGVYDTSDIADAVEHVGRSGKTGTVLLSL